MFAKQLFGFLIVLMLFSTCYADDNLVFYNAGRGDPEAWSVLKEYFASKRYAVAFYQGDSTIERHLEKANRINALKAGAFIGIEFAFGEEKHVMVAMAESGVTQTGSKNESEGNRQLLWSMDELPARHEAQSKRLAELIAAPFQVTVKKIPLFPLLGIDRPGVFLSIHCPKEEAQTLLAMIDGALQKYYRKDRP